MTGDPALTGDLTREPADTEVVAHVVRSGLVESRHHGTLVALDAGGRPVLTVGDPGRAVFPRSASKPLQALGMLRCGLPAEPDPDEGVTGPSPLLALVAASHSGEPFHLAGVRRLLAAAGLSADALQNPPDLPLGDAARADWLRAGHGPEAVAMNCSGKHAGMLATCVVAGWPVETYRDPGHPLQVALRQTVAQLAGEPVAATGVDGCGAPLFALSLTGLARAFRALALAPADTLERRVADAVRAHPAYVGGTGRDVTALIEAVPGLIAKDGAEGVYAAAAPDGRAVALKIEDGSGRARAPVLVAALRRLGVDAPGLQALAAPLVYGGGRPAGEIRAVL